MLKESKTVSPQDAKKVASQNKNSQTLPLVAQKALKESQARKQAAKLAKELNGPKGLEPTRYGDWEAKGRCYDF